MSIELTVVSRAEQQQLLNSINEARDLSLILCLLESDLYVQELIEVKVKDVDLEKKRLSIQGKRARDIELSDNATLALTEWLKVRPKSTAKELFIALQDPYDPLSVSGINYIVKKWGESSGVCHLNATRLRITNAPDDINTHDKTETPPKSDCSKENPKTLPAKRSSHKNNELMGLLAIAGILYLVFKLIFRSHSD